MPLGAAQEAHEHPQGHVIFNLARTDDPVYQPFDEEDLFAQRECCGQLDEPVAICLCGCFSAFMVAMVELIKAHLQE